MTRQLGIEEFLVMFQILGSETIGMIGLLQGEASMNESGNAAPPAKPFDMTPLQERRNRVCAPRGRCIWFEHPRDPAPVRSGPYIGDIRLSPGRWFP